MIGRLAAEALLGADKGVIERIVPGLVPKGWEQQHVSRYYWAARQLRKPVAQRVLDIACGVGYGSQILEMAGYEVVSLDRFRAGLGFGIDEFGVRRPVVADAHELPLRRAHFDAVVSFETIEHVARPDLFLGEVANVLKPQGTLLISTPNAATSGHGNPHHVHEFVLQELVSLLSAQGFLVSAVYGQHLVLHGRLWSKVIVLRRLQYEIQRSSVVRPFRFPFGSAAIWLLCATRKLSAVVS